MAGKQVQRRRGTTAQHTPFIGALGEVTVDTVKMVEVVHDGATPGGFPQASARDIAAVTAATDSKLALKVSQDSATGAAKIPKGTTSQRPVAPQVGDFRYNSTTKKFEGWADPALGWAPVGGDSIPLFSVFWVPLRTNMPAGFVAADGQLLARATYPDAAAGIVAGNVPMTTEANWTASPPGRGCYSPGDGSTTFRMPDYNGKSGGTLGALFLRGDGALSVGSNGSIQMDALQTHGHFLNLAATPTTGTTSGYAEYGKGSGSAYTAGTLTSGSREANETRPLNVSGCWAVKLFGAIINPGAADAAQLATEVANIKADLQNNYYRRNNILGVVGFDGGSVPNGAIIQTGSNSAGLFVRFANGLQICLCGPWNFDVQPNTHNVSPLLGSPAAFMDLVVDIATQATPNVSYVQYGFVSCFMNSLGAYTVVHLNGPSLQTMANIRTVLIGRWA